MAILTPWDYAKAGSEHAHQVALFMWAKMAERYGVTAANDPRAYESESYAKGILLMQKDALPQLKWLFAIPNGGERHMAVALKIAAEGAKKGVYDVFLPLPMQTAIGGRVENGLAWYCGLFIEMKKPTRRNHKDGGLSDQQIAFGNAMTDVGYCCKEAYTWLDAVCILLEYLGYQGVGHGGKGLSEV